MLRLRSVTLILGLWTPTLAGQQRPVQYVDSKACATCHREIAEKYARTGMGRSFFKPAPANTIEAYSEDPEYYHAPSDSHYRMLVRNGEYFQKRWQIGLDGKEINAEELKIDYVIGSGNHGRFYLHRTEQGLLIELPLAWYPEKGGGWALTPGSDLPQPRARTFVAYKCMFCHNAYPQIPPGNEKPGAEPVFTGELPEGIDCQRCHGPGSEHVQTSGRAALVNPAKLSPQGREELCLQCHLETASGDIPAKILRFNRGVFSYTAGEPLADFALFFDYAPGRREDRFEGVGGAYQFRKSRCAIESGGKLECTSCHDPHDVPRGPEAIRHYSGVCLQCHTVAAHPRTVQAGDKVTAADCVTCHMPKRRADDAPHMIFTDHRIQRRAPANALAEFTERAPEPYRGEVVPYYPASPPPLYRAVAQVGTGNNVAAGMPDLVRLIAEQKPREPEFYMILGDGWKALGQPAEAAAAYRRALELQPDLVRALRALGDEDSLARAVRIAPEDAQSWFQYGVLTKSADRIRKAISLNPWFRDQYRELAELTRSEADLKEALRSDPFDDDAWDLGGRIFTEKANYREAFFDFERAIRIRPSGRHLYDYALALVRADRYDEARTQAENAVRADVTMAEPHELLGGLHARKNELPAAAGEYQAALALKPDLWRVHLRLGMVLAAQGDKAAAETHLRAAEEGDDPAIARQASEALKQLAGR